jgi:hypothetical protein
MSKIEEGEKRKQLEYSFQQRSLMSSSGNSPFATFYASNNTGRNAKTGH